MNDEDEAKEDVEAEAKESAKEIDEYVDVDATKESFAALHISRELAKGEEKRKYVPFRFLLFDFIEYRYVNVTEIIAHCHLDDFSVQSHSRKRKGQQEPVLTRFLDMSDRVHFSVEKTRKQQETCCHSEKVFI